MLAKSLRNIAYITFLCFDIHLISLNFPRLLTWKGVGFCQRFFSASREIIVWFFFFQFLCMVDYDDVYFCLFNYLSIPGMKPTRLLWIVFLDSVCEYFFLLTIHMVRFFTSLTYSLVPPLVFVRVLLLWRDRISVETLMKEGIQLKLA